MGAANGLPEIDTQTIFEVCAFGPLLRGRRFPLFAEPLAENVLEVGGITGITAPAATRSLGKHVGKVKTAEAWAARICVRRTTFGHSAVRIESVLIVHLPLLRIVQNSVSFLELFETFFSRFVTGI